MLNNIQRLLKGKKVYLVGIVMIILGMLQDFDQNLIMQGLLVLTGRAAIAKINK